MSCALNDDTSRFMSSCMFTSRPDGCLQPGELWFADILMCIVVCVWLNAFSASHLLLLCLELYN